MCSRHPLHCVIPPHILLELARNGTAAEREWASNALLASEQIRGERQVNAQLFIGSPTGTKRRTIFTAKHATTHPGTLVRGEGDPDSGDAAVNQAYAGLGHTYDFFMEVLQRNSLDDQGLRLDATVHYDVKYPNAFWNGRQMVFGDGDGKLFGSFTSSLDVIAHELSHGVVEYTSALRYKDQPGALNESMADVFGSLVKQYALRQTSDRANWLVGEEVLLPAGDGMAIRSLKAPGTAYNIKKLGKDPQPAHMKDYKPVAFDNGGVHLYSGIPNHAFFLVAKALGGYAWEKAGRIWYDALRRMSPTSNFQDAANLTFETAGALFGAAEQQVVSDAWKQVGIGVQINVHKIVGAEVPAETAAYAA